MQLDKDSANKEGRLLQESQNEVERKAPLDTVNVLVVEDDIDDFYLVRQILSRDKSRKYDIAHCDNLVQSLDLLRRTKVDIILLDLELGDSSGLSTLQNISSEIQHATPIIVLTGNNSIEIGEKAIKQGAEDYLPKEDATASLLSRAIRYAIERHFLLRQFQQRATTDPLTLLSNRSALMDRIESLMLDAARNESRFAIAVLDLDGFKQINDNLGHLAGDQVLKEVANRLKMRLRCSDMAARMGGDEFVILLTNYHNQEELISVVSKKHKVVSQPISLILGEESKIVGVGISTGIAEWEPGLSSQQLLSKADDAMYQSKRNGKNMITMANNLLSDNSKCI